MPRGTTAREQESFRPVTITQIAPEVIARARSGDRQAFGALYQNYGPEIHQYLLRHLNGNRELAEDLGHDVWIKALEGLGSY